MNDDISNTKDTDDLEAQLASLGILGGDDNLGLNGEPALLPSGNTETDLDKQLEMLLMADQNADKNFEAKDLSITRPTQTVYDSEVDGMGAVQYVKGLFVKEADRKTKLFADITWGKIVVTLIVGMFLIGIGAITAILAYSAVQAQQKYIEAVLHFTPIEIPRDTTNNANIVFINERAFIGEQPFTLNRFSAAYSGTFIYFRETFNPNDYYILLFNQARNLYPRTTFDIVAAPNTGTVLKFGALSRNTLFLTLHIQCRASDEFVRFNYRLITPPIHGAPVFINQPVHVLGDYTTAHRLVVRHAVFDSASSKIHFSYMPDLQTAGLRVNRNSDASFVALRDILSVINPLTNENAAVYFDEFGIIIGAATFGPVFSLEGNVKITFNDLLYFYPNPVVEVTPEQLFRNDQSNPIPVQTGKFTLNLEGMSQQGRLIVLTLHGTDETNRRRKTNLDITLRVALNDGFVDMPGYVRVSPYGTDVIFNMSPHGTRLRDAHISQYSLMIDWVEYDVPSVTVLLQVSRFNNMPSIRRHAAELAVTEAFTDLLSHKSGKLSPAGIVGLSPELLRSHELLNEIFAPAEFEGHAMYAVTISAGDLLSNYNYVAMVEVLWTAGEGENFQYFREIFQVTAQSRDSIWSVFEIRV